MAEKCFCHFNGFRVKDSVARQQIVELNNQLSTINANILTLSNTINTMNTFMNALAGDVALLKSRVAALENGSGSGGNTGGDSGGNTGGGSGDSGNEPVVTKLAAPTISLSSGMLTISDNSGGKASMFDVYFDSNKVTTVTANVSGNKTINLEDKTLADFGTYIVRVKAKADGYTTSDFSNSVTFVFEAFRLAAPTIAISGDYLYITDNSNAAESFEIFKNGVSLTTTTSKSVHLPSFLASGTYTITAKAKSSSFTPSAMSNSVTYTRATADTRKTLSGKWLVDETPSISSVFDDGLQESFESRVGVGGVDEITAINIYAGENMIYYEAAGSQGDEPVYNVNTEKWYCTPDIENTVGNRPGLSRQLDFGSGVKVSDDFYNWFTDNATQVTSFPEAPLVNENTVWGTFTFGDNDISDSSFYDDNEGDPYIRYNGNIYYGIGFDGYSDGDMELYLVDAEENYEYLYNATDGWYENPTVLEFLVEPSSAVKNFINTYKNGGTASYTPETYKILDFEDDSGDYTEAGEWLDSMLTVNGAYNRAVFRGRFKDEDDNELAVIVFHNDGEEGDSVYVAESEEDFNDWNWCDSPLNSSWMGNNMTGKKIIVLEEPDGDFASFLAYCCMKIS